MKWRIKRKDDDTRVSSEKAIGWATYSNSDATVFSFMFQYLKTYAFRHTSIRNRNKKRLPDFSFANSS